MKICRFSFTAALVAFVATNFPFGKVGVYARFPTLALLVACTVILVSRLRMQTLSPVLATLYMFLTYSFITVFWTENVWLSLAKWILYAIVALTFFLAGAALAQNSTPDRNPFEPLKWVFIPMIVSSIISLASGNGWVGGNFRGFSGNSNALGASLMLTTPWLIYELKRSWSQKWPRRILLALAGADFCVMMLTHSRAALLGFLILPIFAVAQMKLARKFTIAYVVCVVILTTYAFRPATFDFLYQSYVAKSADTITASRGEQMMDSWDAAKQGGFFGAGFGVSVGLARYWNFTTFSDAGREKGNSFLGIVEETGLVGLCLYLGVLWSLGAVIRKQLSSADENRKFIATIALGYFLTALVHGQFEAWFLSFGPDVSVYWATLGLALGGMSRKTLEHEHNYRVEAAVRPRIFAPSNLARG